MFGATAAAEWMQPYIAVALLAIVVAAVAKVAMPAKKCPACRRKVDRKATVCATCGGGLA